jgi:outer membrane protein
MNPPKPLHAQLAVLTQISACVLALVSTASAQTASSALSAEREKTRASIDEVTADRVREADTSLSLGRRLNPDMATAVSRIEEVAARGKTPYRPAPRHDGLAGLTPEAELVGPAPQRAPRRAAPVLADAQQTPVYTPDFSRQVLSFTQLAGKDVVDLPRSEDPTGAATPALPASEATTWGLPDILAEGLQISPVQKQALSSLEIAQSQKDQAAADWFPSASVRLAAGSTTASPGDLSDGGYRNLSLRLTQPVFNRTLNNNLTNAERSLEAAQLRRTDSLQAVALTLTQATVNLAAARLTINFADEQENQLSNVLRYLDLRAQAGATSQADLERARTRVAAARQTRLDQQAVYKSSLYEVDRLIEQTPMALRLPYLNQLPALPATLNELLALVRQNSAAVQALQRDVQAQQAVVAAQKAKLLPTFGLSLERDVQKNLSGEATAVNSFNRLLGVVSWQASLGGKEMYAADEAQAELRKRQAKLDEESRKLEQAVSSDFASLQSATLRITAAETEQRAALAVTDAVQAQLKSGRLGNLLEALDASDRLFAARSRQIQALAQQFAAQSQLLRQIGLLTGLAAAPAKAAPAPL